MNSVTILLNSDYSDIESITIKMKDTNFDNSKIKEIVLNNFEIDDSKIKIS